MFGGCWILIGAAVLAGSVRTAPAQEDESAAASSAPEVEKTDVRLWSEGVRIAGTVFTPTDRTEGEKLPVIVMSHGWGGTRSHLNSTYAPKFAAAGFIVLTIDYRGWADSEGKLVVQGERPESDENGLVTVTAREIREVVDPLDQVVDIMNAIDYATGLADVDPERIGLWGSSYSGGHMLYVAAHDPGIKAVVSQVSAQDSEKIATRIFEAKGGLEYARELGAKRAHGEIDPIPQGEDVVPGLRGTPDLRKIWRYRPVEDAHRVTAATLIIDAGGEELFDTAEHGGRAYEIIKAGGKAPVKYVVVPEITHYQIYTTHYEKGSGMALEWFNEHLKGDGAASRPAEDSGE